MNLAYLITAHKNPGQLVRLVERLNCDGTSFFVHVDKGTDEATYRHMVDGLKPRPDVHFLTKRFQCHYMTLFSAVQAVVRGIDELLLSGTPFDYVIYLTGQDYPIKTNRQIKTALKNAKGRSFLSYLPLPFEGTHPAGGRIIQNASRIECWHAHLFGHYLRLPLRGSSRFCRAANLMLPKQRRFPRGFQPYGGWAYWCLARQHVLYVHHFVKAHPSFVRFFRFVKSADEICFQTILLNSLFKNRMINDDLRYVDWSTEDCHPKLLRQDDLGPLISSPKLFARKFDSQVDATILDLIDEHILKTQVRKPGAASATVADRLPAYTSA
ncbi:MAG TPA: beta-1,6-N-acetylglucosaminyltransferase [Verrucomicrobiae bacterium]|nr:beta-1,6-N-acetylglucosaminyltransferase [Verrucomicrobiae bacterium]